MELYAFYQPLFLQRIVICKKSGKMYRFFFWNIYYTSICYYGNVFFADLESILAGKFLGFNFDVQLDDIYNQ